MLRLLGYVGQNLSLGVSSSHTTVLRSLTDERLRKLIALNLTELRRILAFNAEHQIKMFRISSGVIPFASHPANQVPWWDEFREPLEWIGEFITEQGMRVSMHPGQFTVINSPNPRVVAAALDDLVWHVRFLDRLRLGPEHKIVVHGGGGYGDMRAALRRLVAAYGNLPDEVRNRLVLENDDRIYTVDDVLEVRALTGMPVVFDTLHHRANPGGRGHPMDALRDAFSTWRPLDGPPKIHFSTQAAGRRSGAHADYLDPVEFGSLLDSTSNFVFDCMLEAKAKDLALLRLRQEVESTAF